MPGPQQSQSSKHQHRATGLRQSNKKNKRSRASKRSRVARSGGKVAATKATTTSSSSASCLASQSKANRRNHQQQIRDAKRQAILRQRRGLSGSQKQSPSAAPPRLVGIVGLSAHPAALEERVRDYLTAHASRVIRHEEDGIAAVSCQYDAHKRESGGGGALTLRTATSLAKNDDDNNNNEDATLWAVLDLARVCDTLLFVVDGDQYASSSQQYSSGSVTTIANAQAADFVVGMEIGGDDEEHDDAKSNKTGHISFQQQQQQRLDHLITDRADRWLSALKAQGLPTPLTVLAATLVDDDDDDQKTMMSVKSVRRSKLKRQLELQRWVRRMATTEFGPNHDKVLEVDLSIQPPSSANNDNTITTATTTGNSNSSNNNLIRTLCTMSCTPAQWVSQLPRAYLVADSIQYDATTRQLQLQGHVRGRAPWNVNALVHVPQIGTVACRSVAPATAPLTALVQQSAARKNNHNPMNASASMITTTSEAEPQDGTTVLADPTQRESLHMYASPDGLEGEQNLIGFESDDEGEEDDTVAPLVPRPAGWSDYQSAWLDAVDGNDADDQHGGQDTGELAQELNRRKGQADASSSVAGATLGDAPMTDMEQHEANQVSETERRALWQERRQKQQSEETDFPDEVQVDEDVKARERFARYRSLTSFRKSHWDPKENLPDTYASIFHLASFTQTQRSVMKDMKALIREANDVEGNFWGKTLPSTNNNDSKPSTTTAEDVDMEVESGDEDDEEEEDFLEGCIPSGSYVTLTLENVSPEAVSALAPNTLLTAVTLLSHENKVSVLHMGLSQTAGCNATTDDPVKSKDLLTFRCGWRTWQARPVFSQNNLNCDKHKFERFLPTGGTFFAASVFGPITYTPCPVLVFRETPSLNDCNNNSSRCQLVAVGSMLGANADRIVVKRIVLTGYPVRVHKRHATVKYMFYDPEDVKWFKPAGLYTKHGLQGNIQQSVGEHGTMKCLFNAPIQQHDTVCLPLYKRIYPKYAEPSHSDIVEQVGISGSGSTVPGGTLVDRQSRSKATSLVVR